jgi:UDP-N-acetylglucosamine 4,6-dehydratase
MITQDDAINTLEFDDCYLIKPVGVLKHRDAVFRLNGQAGKSVNEDFEFSSDANNWWLSGDELANLLLDQDGA